MSQTHEPAAEQEGVVTFHDANEILEIDLSERVFSNSHDVNVLYDDIEQGIADSGEDLWFFLINYTHTRIESAAWVAFSRRGKELNLANSQGTVRFNTSEETRREIEDRANTDHFDANLFADRDAAINRLGEMPSKRRRKAQYTPHYSHDELAARFEFNDQDQILNLDLSNLTFHHKGDVDLFYDCAEERIRERGGRWYLLVNYNHCHINPEAWFEYAKRGKKFNLSHAAASVRYATDAETEEDIRMRADSQGFNPNILRTRQEALARIDEIKRNGE